MLLSTPAYFTFLIAIFFAYWLVSRSRLAALAVIVFANYFFYARWDLIYLALIPAADRDRGLHRLRADLDSGEWRRRWGDLLARDELDLGYRVVTAWPGR